MSRSPFGERINIASLLLPHLQEITLQFQPQVLELNVFRIEQFGLRQYFSVFFSSCFLGLRKPDEAIYRTVLQVTQCQPAECIFIDDREVNLECPRELGVATILFQDAAQLRRELRENGVDL